MKLKKGNIRELLGASQEEMAVLLKISRAQWSMFESGKRDLPFEAKKQFAEMLTYVQSAKEKAAKKKPESAQPNERTARKLKLSLLTNLNRQRIVSKKISDLQKKISGAEAALHLERYCENSKNEQPQFVAVEINKILKRAKEDVQIGESFEMIELQIKLNVLQYEEKLLKAELEKLNTKN
ncbi:MAG: helix-turn-helix transcriptional regulator [Flavobacterium sp. JAD_PAG50586_2]|nr:MAG: helix-turn-helix transcriptional regulator [Flavobacterium sp. JAD_PAG50586_2]